MINIVSFALSGLVGAAKKAAESADKIVNADSAVPARNSGNNTIILRTPATMAGYDPESPYANKQGFVMKQNVNITEEMIHLEEAQQAYTANAVVMARVNALKEALSNNTPLNFIDQQA